MLKQENTFDPLDEDPEMSRRRFLSLLGWGAIVSVSGLMGSALLGCFKPTLLPNYIFSIGHPERVMATEGRILIKEKKVFVEVSKGRLRCMTAICSHLGCTLSAIENGFQCSCQGSSYDQDGRQTSATSSLPLAYYRVFQNSSGELFIDKGQIIHLPREAWFTPKIT